jgi:hypothetical protein
MEDQVNKSSKDMQPVPAEQIDVEEGSTHQSHSNTYNAALKLAAAHDGEEVDSDAEKRLIKKIDWYLMPLVR